MIKILILLSLAAYLIFVCFVIYLIFKAHKSDEDECKVDGKAEKSLLDND